MSRLIKCPECEAEMKREVGAVCPQCGFRITDANKPAIFAKTRTQKEWFFGFLGINLIIFAILTFAIGMSGAKKLDLDIILLMMYGVIEFGVLSSKYIHKKNKIIFTFIIVFIVCIFKFA